jgi:hypothetical protein
MTEQRIKTGDSSTNIQIGTITQGLTVSEVRQIALDIFRANFFNLSTVAKNIAEQRAKKITEDFLNKLQMQHPQGLQLAQDPDFQHALFTVQKEHARCEDKDLGELLVDLLVDRTKQQSRSILQIVLNESLTVAPKLTLDQLAALSLVFVLRYTEDPSIKTHQRLWDYLDRYLAPFAPLISAKAACYQHLEYSGCGTVVPEKINLAEQFRKNYGGLFSVGFSATRRMAKLLSIKDSHPIFIRCINDSSRYQINAINEKAIRSECERFGVLEEDVKKVLDLYNESLMERDEVQKLIIKSRGFMRTVFDVWENSQMGHFTLTSVGIAIGHANVKKNVGKFTDISIWIN